MVSASCGVVGFCLISREKEKTKTVMSDGGALPEKNAIDPHCHSYCTAVYVYCSL